MPTASVPELVRRGDPSRRQWHWDAPASEVLRSSGGFRRVLGGPGTGKTALLAELVADRVVRGGIDPESILLIVSGRAAAARVRASVTRRIAELSGAGDVEQGDEPGSGDGHDPTVPRTAREPLVRTVHSYAFAVLRARARRDGAPAPRLLSEPEQDAEILDLLEGDVEAGGRDWPDRLRPALAMPGFAAELRDLLLRAAERGVGPRELGRLGAEHDRPEWVAAGRFGTQYRQVTMLRGAVGAGAERGGPALDAAELVTSALQGFDEDPSLLAGEQARVRYLLVDDAQNLAPQQYWLLRRLGKSAAEFVLAGDPDQAVFGFLGADPRCLTEADPGGERTTVLRVGHRMAPAVRDVVRRLAARLPGSGPQREALLTGDSAGDREVAGSGETGSSGDVRVRLFASAAREAAWVGDQLRRAHLLDGVPWSRMAVVVRSTGRSLPVLRRALLAAGVPLAPPVDDEPLAQRSAVRPLLALLRCAARPAELDSETAGELLQSPLGGADALALRRLRRGLRRLEVASGGSRSSGELLPEVLLDTDRLAGLEDAAAAPARSVAELLRLAREANASGAGVEQALWRVWRASDLERRWLRQSERGGAAGAQADRDLDAVVALFEEAATYTDQWPGADAGAFADHLGAQRIAGTTLAPTAPVGESVPVLTAHDAAGQEWDVLAVPGVQEGVWPDLRPRGSLLGTEKLVDLLSGVDSTDAVSATAPLLAEERRLLLLAASRARNTLLVSAVRGEDEQPSRFLDELDELDTASQESERPLHQPERALALPELVGELRRVVCGDDDPERRRRAARQLARLAAAGVPGAHPDTWYGLSAESTSDPILAEGEPVRVSPSTVDTLVRCPLRWFVERHGGQDAAELASVTGTLVHALVQAAADDPDPERLRSALDQAWQEVDAGAPWFSRRERQRVERMLDAFVAWLSQSRGEFDQLGVERDLDVSVPASPGGPWLRLRGRVDRLESDQRGRPVVIDVKTAKTPISKAEADEHPQLAVYQLAAALGAFDQATGADSAGTVDPKDPGEPGGARLLYVAKPDRTGAATERAQDDLDPGKVQVWLELVREAAAASTGPDFLAAENSDCPRCPARTCCPLQPSGRQVTE